VILSIISPYTRCSLDFLGKELNNVDLATVESILIQLILEGKVKGSIDQVTGMLIMDDLDEERNAEVERLENMLNLTNSLANQTSTIMNSIGKINSDSSSLGMGGMAMAMW